jgi:uncharacterized membrane protein
MSAPNSDPPPVFQALIHPHASLSRGGWWWLGGGLTVAVAATGLRFWLIGAWPVAIFAALEIGLFLILFARHTRAMRRTELILLTPGELTIIRTDPAGRRSERRLQPAWLNVMLQDRTGRVPALFLATRGVREEIATCLGESEKRSLAAALGTALHRLRNPRFDNPQLRDPA